MPRLTLPVALSLGALGLCALPALVHAQGVADRYGPEPQGLAGAPAAAPPSPMRLRGRVLSWPGKAVVGLPTAPQAVQLRPPYTGAPFAAASRAGSPRPTFASSPETFAGEARAADARDPDPRAIVSERTPAGVEPGWRPVYAAPAAAPEPAFAGAPPMTPPVYSAASRAASAPPPHGSAAQRYGYDPSQPQRVRFYSVHRPFGLRPDPAPIPPAFFTTTADLAEPPPAAPTERSSVAVGSGASRIVRAAPDTSIN